jgi:hypothetical protein
MSVSVFTPATVGNLVDHYLYSTNADMTERKVWKNYAQPIVVPRNTSKGKSLDIFVHGL